MKVKEVMTKKIEMIRSDAMVSEATRLMKSLDVGVLPVQETNKLIGVITDRDVVCRVIAAGRDAKITSVKEVMTPEVFSCSEDEDIEEAAKLMEEKRVHRLMVLNDQNKPVGIFTLSDIAVKACDEHLSWEVLEKICEPAHPNR
jgi:CBS domain-containing protein